MANEDIRNAIADAGLKYWQVADALNVYDSTLTKWLRHDLSDEKRARVMAAISTLSELSQEHENEEN